MKSKNSATLRRRVVTPQSSLSKTDQSDVKSSDINTIMSQYQKTGMLPNIKEHVGQYLDSTNIPSFTEAFYLVQDAKDSFMQLPASIRRDMNNDPKLLESYLSNPDNYEKLKKYGLVIDTPKPSKPKTSDPVKDPTTKGPDKGSDKTMGTTDS